MGAGSGRGRPSRSSSGRHLYRKMRPKMGLQADGSGGGGGRAAAVGTVPNEHSHQTTSSGQASAPASIPGRLAPGKLRATVTGAQHYSLRARHHASPSPSAHKSSLGSLSAHPHSQIGQKRVSHCQRAEKWCSPLPPSSKPAPKTGTHWARARPPPLHVRDGLKLGHVERVQLLHLHARGAHLLHHGGVQPGVPVHRRPRHLYRHATLEHGDGGGPSRQKGGSPGRCRRAT